MPILREHYAIMNELKRRGHPELEIEVGITLDTV
jgi:hypothetical protein